MFVFLAIVLVTLSSSPRSVHGRTEGKLLGEKWFVSLPMFLSLKYSEPTMIE